MASPWPAGEKRRGRDGIHSTALRVYGVCMCAVCAVLPVHCALCTVCCVLCILTGVSSPASSSFSPQMRDLPHVRHDRGEHEVSVRPPRGEALASYCTLYTPFIHRYCRICTYVHPLYMYIHHIHTIYTPLNTSKHPKYTIYTPLHDKVKRSLVAAAGGLFRLPNKIPHHIAMEMILTGDRTSLCNGLYVWRGDHLCVRVHVRVMGLLGRVLYGTQHSPNLSFSFFFFFFYFFLYFFFFQVFPPRALTTLEW